MQATLFWFGNNILDFPGLAAILVVGVTGWLPATPASALWRKGTGQYPKSTFVKYSQSADVALTEKHILIAELASGPPRVLTFSALACSFG